MTASGSTAQANAMTKFVAAYGKVCAGQTLNYTASGSGAVDAISSVEAPAPE